LWKHLFETSRLEGKYTLSLAMLKWVSFKASVKINTPKARFFWKEAYKDYFKSHGVFLPMLVTEEMMSATFATPRELQIVGCSLSLSLPPCGWVFLFVFLLEPY